MPVYEYLCEKCGEFEHTQRITDPPLARCPSCRRKVRRLISSTSFQLKGGGWYVTDYARAGKTGGTGGSGGASSDKAASKDSSQDSSKDSSTKDSGKDSGKDSSSSSESTSSKPSGGKSAAADA